MKRPPSCGPGLQDGKVEQVDVLEAMDDLLAGCVFGGDDFGEEAADFGQLRQHLELVHEAGRHLRLQEQSDAVGDGVERVGFEGELHAAFAAELVHQDACAGMAFYVLKEEGGATGFGGASAELGGAVGDLGHLQDRVDLLR